MLSFDLYRAFYLFGHQILKRSLLLCSNECVWNRIIYSFERWIERIEGVTIGGKRERNLKEGGNMKFIVPASLTLEKKRKEWHLGITNEDCVSHLRSCLVWLERKAIFPSPSAKFLFWTEKYHFVPFNQFTIRNTG